MLAGGIIQHILKFFSSYVTLHLLIFLSKVCTASHMESKTQEERNNFNQESINDDGTDHSLERLLLLCSSR